MSNSPLAPTDPTSLTLIGSAKDRNPDSWRRLVELYSPSIFGWAKRADLRDEDAADIVQDVWTNVSSALTRFQRDPHTGTFRGWLWTITRNSIADFGRRRQHSAVAAGGTNAHLALQNVPEWEPPEATTIDTPGMIDRAIELIRSDFEERTWQAFWRVAVLGQAARDVGTELGMAANTVHQSKFRVLKRLRQELTQLGVADDPTFVQFLPSA